jgi:hypothetical protein
MATSLIYTARVQWAVQIHETDISTASKTGDWLASLVIYHGSHILIADR